MFKCRLEKLLAAERALDTVVWQLLASVICPGYTIHTVVALAHAGLIPLEVRTVYFLRLHPPALAFYSAWTAVLAVC